MKKTYLFVAASLILASCGNTNHKPVLAEFENVYFDNVSVTYDGEPHILGEVRGAPEETTITYTGREEHTNAGTYSASALLSKEGYNNKTLYATLTINKVSFENIVFDDGTFEYDGLEHSIYVSGEPSFATVTYSNNGKVNPGTYTVTATIRADNYNTLTKTATMTIIGKEITGVTLDNQTLQYDGKSHSLEVSGELPSGVTVSYKNNGKTDSGTYNVTATLSGEGYETLVLNATLTIEPAPVNLKNVYFLDRAYIYDGQNHNVYVEGVSDSYTVTYKCLNTTGTNTFKECGVYEVEASIKEDKNHISKKYALLTITNEATCDIDQSKTPLEINEDLKWDDLYDALEQDNFTMQYYSGTYNVANIGDPMPADIFSSSFSGHQSGHIFATDGKEAFQHSYSMNESTTNNYYDYYKEVGDDIIHVEIKDEYHNGSTSKFPKAAFSETVAKYFSEDAFVALTKGSDGEFLVGIDGDDYYGNAGIPYIEDGIFTVIMEHYRSVSSGGYDYIYDIYRFYNIGNTTVDVPSNFVPSQDYIDNKLGVESIIYLGGVKYTGYFPSPVSYPTLYYYSAQLYVNYARAVYMKAGTYYVLPNIYDRVVTAIIYSSSSNIRKGNQTGYNYRLLIDSNGVYQGEYAEYGSIGKNDIKTFTNAGGTVEYYDQWHD